MSRPNFTTACVLLSICLLLASAVPARVIYVDDDAVGVEDGSSWVNAYADLQQALASARIGDEIRIAQGLYTPQTNPAGLPLHWSSIFELTGGLTLKGGYVGLSGQNPDVRDSELYETVLSGDVNRDDVDVPDPCDLKREPTRADNRTVVICNLPPRNILDGLTITGGVGNGLQVSGVRLIVRNCAFTHNYGDQGGAVAVSKGDVQLEDCLFFSNGTHNSGAGLYLAGSGATVTRCRFVANDARRSGGGSMGLDAIASFSGCTFAENLAANGGGLADQGSSLQVTDCVFRGNSATGFGGAAQLNPTWPGQGGVFSDCCFEGNIAGSGGGAIDGRLLVLDRCRFIRNSAKDYGGALIHTTWPSIVGNCLFTGNRAAEGGAMSCSCEGPLLVNCTLTGNLAHMGRGLAWSACPPPRPGGGVVKRPPFSMTMTNCILWNGADEIGSHVSDPPEIAITYSNVQGGWPGEGNIDADPRFIDLGYWDPNGTADDPNDDFWVEGDYHLKSQAGRWDPNSESWVKDDVTSPCIDTGDPNSPIGDEPEPNGSRINMGAYGGTAEASMSPDTGA